MKMKYAILSLFLAGAPCLDALAQQATLTKLWSTDTTLKVPESVCFDAKRNILYVTNIDGQPWGKDGQGFVSRVSPKDGKIVSLRWVEGLHAPKGMGLYKNRLYVADLNEVVVIDIEKGAIEKRIAIANAEGLNDVTVAPNGQVLVTDSRKKTVHVVVPETNSGPYLDSARSGLKGPNGILAGPAGLLVLDDSSVKLAGVDGTLTKVAPASNGADGIEHVKGDEYIVSCWKGDVYYVNIKNNSADKILDTQAEKLQTADIGYDPKKKIVYIPTFFGNHVTAYKLTVN